MNIEALTVYLNASPEARALIEHLACKLAESEATRDGVREALGGAEREIEELSAELRRRGESPPPTDSKQTGVQSRKHIMEIARLAFDTNKDRKVKATIRVGALSSWTEQTEIATINTFDDSREPLFLAFPNRGLRWYSLACETRIGVVALELVPETANPPEGEPSIMSRAQILEVAREAMRTGRLVKVSTQYDDNRVATWETKITRIDSVPIRCETCNPCTGEHWQWLAADDNALGGILAMELVPE